VQSDQARQNQPRILGKPAQRASFPGGRSGELKAIPHSEFRIASDGQAQRNVKLVKRATALHNRRM
jgi:hypothetical protein